MKNGIVHTLMYPSVIILIAVNLLPLFGVLFLRWELFPLLLLFWMENVIIGIINAVKMLFSMPHDSSQWPAKLFFIPFFCIHYGIFTLVHGVFIFVFFGGVLTGNNENSDLTLPLHSFQYSGLWLMAIGLFISHTASFILNYIQKGEFRRTSLMKLMIQPYGRVVILHIAILGSGFLIMMLGAPAVSLVILVFLKIVLDVWGHLRQHRDFSSTAEKTGL